MLRHESGLSVDVEQEMVARVRVEKLEEEGRIEKEDRKMVKNTKRHNNNTTTVTSMSVKCRF